MQTASTYLDTFLSFGRCEWWGRISKMVAFVFIKFELLHFFVSFLLSVHEVFSRNHAAPFSKVLTFLRRGPFELEAFYSDPQAVPYPEAKIGKQVHGVHLLLE